MVSSTASSTGTSRLRDAAIAWVRANGLHHRDAGGKLHFDWREHGNSRRGNPPCMVYPSTGCGWDARAGERINATTLANRDGQELKAFLDRWAPEPTGHPRVAPHVGGRSTPCLTAPSSPLEQLRRLDLEAAWNALLSGDTDEDCARVERITEATAAWIERARGLFPFANAVSHVRVVDNRTGTSLLAACNGPNERRTLAKALPVAVMPMRNPSTGSICGLAWRQATGSVRRVLSGSRKAALDGTPHLFGNRVDLLPYAETIIVVEGMADVLAIQSILPPVPACVTTPPVTVVGAVDAGQLKKLGPWLARTLGKNASVVVVPHLDVHSRTAAFGVGEAAAGEMLRDLRARNDGNHRDRAINWGVWCSELLARGMTGDAEIKDAADVVNAARSSKVSAATVWHALLAASVGGKP